MSPFLITVIVTHIQRLVNFVNVQLPEEPTNHLENSATQSTHNVISINRYSNSPHLYWIYSSFVGMKIIPTLAEHQVRILARKFAERSQAVLDKQQVMAIVQEELRKSNYDNFDSIFVSLQYQDKNKWVVVCHLNLWRIFYVIHIAQWQWQKRYIWELTIVSYTLEA